MDADELATPGYSVLSPAIRTKLATLEKGQLMIRHPHFTQPIFVRFPRPAVMTGRAGAEQYPQAGELGLEESVYRSLRRLDPSITLNQVQDAVGIHEERDILRACTLTQQERPSDVLGAFRRHLPRLVGGSLPKPQRAVPALSVLRGDDPYGS